MKQSTFVLIISFILFSCNNHSPEETKSDTIIFNHDTVPELRNTVKSEAIESYKEKVDNELNDWVFAVQIFQTAQTFHFLMKIKYEEVFATDTLKIPNLGIDPKIEIHKGKEKNSCIVGFYDKQNTFREYKLVAVKNNQLQIKTLQHYGVYNTIKSVK